MNHDPEHSALPRELEHALEAPPVSAPAMFTDRVMARIAEVRRAGARAPEFRTAAAGWPGAPALEWWVSAAADPAVALAFALAALLIWRANAIVPACEAALARLLSAPAAAAAPPGLGALARAMPHGVAAVALALAILPVFAWGSWRLGQWIERSSLPRLGPAGPR
ncbi:MAG: hypothetical protein ACRENS_03280 [Candidatus Eiseniibacteriota bacterium]